MELQEILGRIERRLSAVGKNAHAASKEANKPDAIRNLQRAVENGGREGVSTATLAALAAPLRTTAEWLAAGVGKEDIDAAISTIPVRGRAMAAGEVFLGPSGAPIGHIAAPEQYTHLTSAIEIASDAALGAAFEKWYAIYEETDKAPTITMLGKLCILGLSDNRIYIRKLARGRGKSFILQSSYDPPVYNVHVKWAAIVESMVQR